MLIRENVPISSLTTMRLGGNARYVIEVETPDDVKEAYLFAEEKGLPVWIMGGGANTIGRDDGFDGVIILNRIKGIYAKVGDEYVEIDDFNAELNGDPKLILTAMGGEIWDDLVKVACDLEYSGIEAISLIPGTVGAAPVQNIGAYGQDISQVIKSVEAYDTQKREIVHLEKGDMRMGYRNTRFNFGEDAGRFFIISITIELSRNRLEPPFYNSLQKYIEEHNEKDFGPRNIRKMVSIIRNGKLPDPEEIASAGSFFKNVYLTADEIKDAEAKNIPVWKSEDGSGKINSGWLIEECELKGKELFGFRVSDKAALVLINESAQCYSDLKKAREEIINSVYAKFGYVLEQEPVEIFNEESKE